MKNSIKAIILFITFTCIPSSILSQHKTYREVEPFNKVSVGSGITLYLIQNGKNEIEIDSKYSHINKIVTKVEGEHLKIFANERNCWSTEDAPIIYLSFNQINEINCGSATDVRCQTVIRVPKLTVKTDGGADILVNTSIANLRLFLKGGSNVRATGRAYKLTATVEDGSSLNTRELISESVNIISIGGSKAEVNTGENFIAEAKESGKIEYYGNPSWTDFTETKGGQISKIEE